MASESSAKAGSKAFRGNGVSPSAPALADSRNDERDDGRSGVVGREVLARGSSDAIITVGGYHRLGKRVRGSSLPSPRQWRLGACFEVTQEPCIGVFASNFLRKNTPPSPEHPPLEVACLRRSKSPK